VLFVLSGCTFAIGILRVCVPRRPLLGEVGEKMEAYDC